MFGNPMEMTTHGGINIRLAPPSKADLQKFVDNWGMQSLDITRYLGRSAAPVSEDQAEYYDMLRNRDDGVNWCIFAQSGGSWEPIGMTSINNIHTPLFKQGTTGIIIFRKDYWGKGVASVCHHARTMFAFDELGIVCLRSAAFEDNEASGKALMRIGYVQVGLELNRRIHKGKRLHMRNFEMVNPYDALWDAWWSDSDIPQEFEAARQRTLSVLEWAHHNVKYL